MKVILVEDVPQLGQVGDVVDVAAGYARNYLVPQSLAVKASTGALAEAEKKRHVREEADARVRVAAEGLAEALADTRVVVAANAGDEGRLFGSVSEVDIAEAVHKFTGIELDRAFIDLEAPIKEIGIHEVSIKPHSEVEFSLNLDIIPA